MDKFFMGLSAASMITFGLYYLDVKYNQARITIYLAKKFF